MAVATLLERQILDAAEPRWRRKGYQLIRNPSPDQLPAFLEGASLDAIAIGAEPSLAIEVLTTGRSGPRSKVSQLKSLLDGRNDWRLEVIYAYPASPDLHGEKPDEIMSMISTAREISAVDRRVALVTAWSMLEASARILEPTSAIQPLSADMLIDMLVSMGHVPQSDTANLRRLGHLRNAIAHGQLHVHPTADDISYLLETAENLTKGSTSE